MSDVKVVREIRIFDIKEGVGVDHNWTACIRKGENFELLDITRNTRNGGALTIGFTSVSELRTMIVALLEIRDIAERVIAIDEQVRS